MSNNRDKRTERFTHTKTHVSSYEDGMDRDTSTENYPKSKYYDCLNFEDITDENGRSNGSKTLKRGNEEIFSLPDVKIYSLVKTGNQSVTGYNVRLGNFTVMSNVTKPLADLTAQEILDSIENLFSNPAHYSLKVLREFGFEYNNVSTKQTAFIAIALQPQIGGFSNFNINLQNAGGANIGTDLRNTASNIIIGANNLRDDIIAVTSPDTFEKNTEVTRLLEYNFPLYKQYNSIWRIKTSRNGDIVEDIDLVFHSNLNITKAHPIKKLITRYETPLIGKVYFTDGYNFFKWANVYDTELIKKEGDSLNVVSGINFGTFQLDNVEDRGTIRAGTIQYIYQLYNKNGNESFVSPPSDMYSVSNYSNRGSKESEICSRNYTLTINDLDNRFSHIKVYRVHYIVPDSTPTVTLIEETEFSPSYSKTKNTFTFTDDGTNDLGQEDVSILSIAQTDNFISQDFDTKDNNLFHVNIKEEDFIVNGYDTRVFSFKRNSNQLVLKDKTGTEINTSPNTLTPFNVKRIDSSIVPRTHDCINPNYWNDVNNTEEKGNPNIKAQDHYIYKFNSEIIGGSGRNISFELISDKDLDISKGPDDTDAGCFLRPVIDSTGYRKDFTSPYYLDLASYAEGEIYRFAIQFFNEYGKKSPANWIADIKIPDGNSISNPSNQFQDTFNTNNDIITAKPKYIKFEVDITQSLLDQGVKGFQIVRVKRERKDKTVLANGTLRKFHRYYQDINNTISQRWQPMPLVGQENPSPLGDSEAVSFARLVDDNDRMSSWGNSREIDNEPNVLSSRLFLKKYSGDILAIIPESSEPALIPKSFESVQFYSPEASFQELTPQECTGTELTLVGAAYLRMSGKNKSDGEFNDNPRVPQIGNSTYYSQGFQMLRARQRSFNSEELLIAESASLVKSPFSFNDVNDIRVEGANVQGGISGQMRNYSNHLYSSTGVYNWPLVHIANTDSFRTKGGMSGTNMILHLNKPDYHYTQGSNLSFFNQFELYDSNNNFTSCNNILKQGDSNYDNNLTSGELMFENAEKAENLMPIVSLRKRQNSQYGGLSYEERSRNSYAPASSIVSVDSTGTKETVARKGDTFIGMYESMVLQPYASRQGQFFDGTSAPQWAGGDLVRAYGGNFYNQYTMMMPLEASINYPLRSSLSRFTGGAGTVFQREYGNHTITLAEQLELSALPQARGFEDVFQSNRVYDIPRRDVVNTALPFNIESIKEFDNRSKYSDNKSNGELIDNFLIYRANNFYDVNGNYGPLTSINELKDELYFTQKNAFGVFVINPNVQVSADGIQVFLGKGELLYDTKYFDTNNGAESNFHTAVGNYSMIFYNANSGRVVRYNGETQEISIMKGMDSWFRQVREQSVGYPEELSYKNNNPYASGIVIGYDPLYKHYNINFKQVNNITPEITEFEGGGSTTGPGLMFMAVIIWNIMNKVKEDNNVTYIKDNIVFSELYDQFRGRVSYNSALYFNKDNQYYSLSPDNKKIYLHNHGRPVIYYNESYDASITYLINPNGYSNCIYNVFELYSEAFALPDYSTTINTPEEVQETFDELILANDYQESETIDLTKWFKRRVRKWRINKKLRDKNNKRFRDRFIFAKFIKKRKQNALSHNFSLVLNRLYTYFNIMDL